MSVTMAQDLSQEGGGFAERCFPKTYARYLRSETQEFEPNKDSFDVFIGHRFSFFRFLVGAYYDHGKKEQLQFRHIASSDRAATLDDLLVAHLTTGLKQYYRSAEELFVYILEEFVVTTLAAYTGSECVETVESRKSSASVATNFKPTLEQRVAEVPAVSYVLNLVRETRRYLRWDGLSHGVRIELYIPNWRIPSPTPTQVVLNVRLLVFDLQHRAPTSEDAKQAILDEPIVSTLSYLREHAKTFRFDPIGPESEWQLGSLYLPKHLFGKSAPRHIIVEVEWNFKGK